MSDHLPDIPPANNPFRQVGTERLQDVVVDALDEGESVSYRGFHITKAGEGHVVIPDGYAGEVDTIYADDFENVRQLIAYLNAIAMRFYEEWDDDDKLEYVGPKGTTDKQKAEESDYHVFIPERERGR